MSLLLLAQLINITANVLTVLVFVWVIVSWILAPTHPIREALDRADGATSGANSPHPASHGSN